MKTSRLITFGIIGVVAGLLIENTLMRARQKAREEQRHLAKKARTLRQVLHKQLHDA